MSVCTQEGCRGLCPSCHTGCLLASTKELVACLNCKTSMSYAAVVSFMKMFPQAPHQREELRKELREEPPMYPGLISRKDPEPVEPVKETLPTPPAPTSVPTVQSEPRIRLEPFNLRYSRQIQLSVMVRFLGLKKTAKLCRVTENTVTEFIEVGGWYGDGRGWMVDAERRIYRAIDKWTAK